MSATDTIAREKTVAPTLAAAMAELGRKAREAAAALALARSGVKVTALIAAAKAVRRRQNEILAANAEDVSAAKASGIGAALTAAHRELRPELGRAARIALALALAFAAALAAPVSSVPAALIGTAVLGAGAIVLRAIPVELLQLLRPRDE